MNMSESLRACKRIWISGLNYIFIKGSWENFIQNIFHELLKSNKNTKYVVSFFLKNLHGIAIVESFGSGLYSSLGKYSMVEQW